MQLSVYSGNMETVRKAWTDERLDDLAKRVDEIAVRMDSGFAEMRTDFKDLRRDFDRRFDALQLTMLTGFISLSVALIVSRVL